MTPLYLLRHGPTAASLAGAPLGHLDLPVCPTGQADWARVKAALQALPIERVFCSPLQRSRLHAQDLGLPCRVIEGLREQAFGAWDGRPWAEFDPASTAAFFTDPIQGVPPGGESFATCAARAISALETLLEPEGPPTLILAHGGPLKAVTGHLLGLPLERALDLAWAPFGLSLLRCYAPGRAVLAFHNRSLQDLSPHALLES